MDRCEREEGGRTLEEGESRRFVVFVLEEEVEVEVVVGKFKEEVGGGGEEGLKS